MVAWTYATRFALAVYLGLLAVGLFLFVQPSPDAATEVYGSAPPPGGERLNLARMEHGARVVVSSAHTEIHRNHHPLYLIDGRATPSQTEKWVSAKRDLEPWLEVRLAGAYDLDEVVLVHAGAYERSAVTARDFEVACLAGGAVIDSESVSDNRRPRSRHALSCPQADAVRVTFQIVPESLLEVARIYEIEVWGR